MRNVLVSDREEEEEVEGDDDDENGGKLREKDTGTTFLVK